VTQRITGHELAVGADTIVDLPATALILGVGAEDVGLRGKAAFVYVASVEGEPDTTVHTIQLLKTDAEIIDPGDDALHTYLGSVTLDVVYHVFDLAAVDPNWKTAVEQPHFIPMVSRL
jgi:hypothetical protein